MIFTPVNNYIYVERAPVPSALKDTILLPKDYRSEESPFAVVEVVGCSGESGTLWLSGLRLVVETQMLNDIEHGGEIFTVIKENYVIGILSD